MPLHEHIALDIAVTTTILPVASSNAPLTAVVREPLARSNLFLATRLEFSGVASMGFQGIDDL